jgi:SAM-dependent methyltransferase
MTGLLERILPWAARWRGSGLKTRLLNPHEEWCDRRLGIRSAGFTPAVGAPDTPHWRGHYEPTRYRDLFRMLRHARIGADDVYVDLGCGMGRTVFAAHSLGAKRAIGVDIDPALIAACQANLARSRGGAAGIEFVTAAAETFAHDDTTVLFMFHPFGDGTLRAVIDALGEAQRRRPRTLRVVYHNPVYDELLGASGWLRRTDHWPAARHGYPVSFWSS